MLILVCVGALTLASPIAIIIASILAIVVFSCLPSGGAYIVAKDNLGKTPSLIAAASLLIDYVLIVAVSIAAGVVAPRRRFHNGNAIALKWCSRFCSC